MKIERLEDETIHFHYHEKPKNAREFLDFKNIIFSELQNNPSLKNLVFFLDASPLDLNLLAILLLLSRNYEVQIQTSNYSNFRMLNNLFLLEKLNVQYKKGSENAKKLVPSF